MRVLRVSTGRWFSTGRWYRQTDVSWPCLCFGMKYAMAFACCHMVDIKMRMRKHVSLLMSEILWLNSFNCHKAVLNVALFIMLNITWYTDISEQTNDSKAFMYFMYFSNESCNHFMSADEWCQQWVMRWLYHRFHPDGYVSTMLVACLFLARWARALHHQICLVNMY